MFSNVGTTSPAVSVGTVTAEMALSATDEGIFLFTGADGNTPNTFLAAIANATAVDGFGSLDGTGLVAGATAQLLPPSTDVTAYTGPRSDLDRTGYRLALNLPDNFATQAGSGDQQSDGTAPDLPFDAAPFTFGDGGLVLPTVGFTEAYQTIREGLVEEEVRVSDLELDSTAYPDAGILRQSHALGRLTVSGVDGDADGDGDVDQIYVYGGRSFSIWRAATGELVFDSGDQLERLTAADPVFGELFNASNDNNSFKNRSDNKGPEPESVTTAVINGTVYGFVALERTGGIVVYDLSNPAGPVFVEYVNSRTPGDDEGGDLGPEGILHIQPANSPIDTGLIVVANEVSATISVYVVEEDQVSSVVTPVRAAPCRSSRTRPRRGAPSFSAAP